MLRSNIYLNLETLFITATINIYFNSVINISKGLFLTFIKLPKIKASHF